MLLAWRCCRCHGGADPLRLPQASSVGVPIQAKEAKDKAPVPEKVEAGEADQESRDAAPTGEATLYEEAAHEEEEDGEEEEEEDVEVILPSGETSRA